MLHKPVGDKLKRRPTKAELRASQTRMRLLRTAAGAAAESHGMLVALLSGLKRAEQAATVKRQAVELERQAGILLPGGFRSG